MVRYAWMSLALVSGAALVLGMVPIVTSVAWVAEPAPPTAHEQALLAAGWQRERDPSAQGLAALGVVVWGFGLLALLFGLVVLAPLGLLWGGSRLRKLGVLVAGYAAAEALLGLFAYACLPAQYTRNGDFRALPRSSPLWEQHAVSLERAANPAAVSPGQAPAVRGEVEEEQLAFAQRWALAAGLGLLALAACYGATRRQAPQ